MKKTIIFLILIILCTSMPVSASSLFDKILSEEIKEYGVLSDGRGIIYADEKNFEERGSLFIVSIDGDLVECRVYDDADGIQLTDTLSVTLNAQNTKIASVKKDGRDYIMISSVSDGKTANKFFAVQSDTFTSVDALNYDSITNLAGYENGKITVYTNTEDVFHFLNRLKEKTLTEYSFPNKINTVSDEDLTEIKTTITACADIMSFDIKDYDYDRLFKYVLYTHENFRLLTDIEPMSGSSSSLGYNNVSIVSSDFIDFVMENVLRITPEKPPVNNLLSRGFCYSGGYYYYTGGFEAYFATQILDIAGVYDLGGNALFVVFSDIYEENNTKTPEYSFAIMQKTGSGYSLLRLGMGENLPSQDELRLYSPFSSDKNAGWGSDVPQENKRLTDSGLLLPLLLLIISVGAVGFVCSIVFLIKNRRK